MNVFYRKKINMPFTYLGSTQTSDVVQYRNAPINANSDPNDRLQIHLVIPGANVLNKKIESDFFEGSGKYKRAILEYMIFPLTHNINVGFYKH